MKIGFAQINPTVGDLSGNFERIIGSYERLAAAGAELVLTPELAVPGYPPQDLVFKSRFVPENLQVLDKLHARVENVPLLVGFVDRNEGAMRGAANRFIMPPPYSSAANRSAKRTSRSYLLTMSSMKIVILNRPAGSNHLMCAAKESGHFYRVGSIVSSPRISAVSQ